MSVIDKAIELFPGTTAEDWRLIGKAAVHSSVKPSEACLFPGPAIVRGGFFRGGVFFGGVFRGGLFFDGVFRGGLFFDGVFRGGEFFGGEFFGGEFRGGLFRGGKFKSSPRVVLGVLPWPATRQGEGDDRIAVGCECRSLEDWEQNIDAIAEMHGVAAMTKAKVLRAVQFLSEN